MKLILNEGYDTNPLEGLRSNMFEFPNGEYLYFEFDEDTGKIYAGGATNVGIIHEFEMDYDFDCDVDTNLQALWDLIVDDRPEYLIDESLDTTKKEKKLYCCYCGEKLDENGKCVHCDKSLQEDNEKDYEGEVDYDFLKDECVQAECDKTDTSDKDTDNVLVECQKIVDEEVNAKGRITKDTWKKLHKQNMTAVKTDEGYRVVNRSELLDCAEKPLKECEKIEERLILTPEGINARLADLQFYLKDWKKKFIETQSEQDVEQSKWNEDAFNSFCDSLK